jgi:hypothetical protein
MKQLAILFILAFLGSSLHAQDAKTERFLEVAKRIGEKFNENNYTPIIEKEFDANLKKALPFKILQPLLDEIRHELGAITRMGRPQIVSADVAVIPIEFERGVLDMQLALNKSDQVIGILFKEHTPPLRLPEMNGIKLTLPFKGDWYVLWGGDTRELNYHVDYQNQNHAFDMSMLGTDARRYKTDGKTNEDYYAFMQKIIAPADGIVTEAIDGVRDNEVGSLNNYSAMGNCVIIMHSDSEYSVFAHFKQGSVAVKKGDKIKRGQLLGLCGNSGNSSEPHLHYHLENSPILQIATGIKVYFDDIVLKNIPEGKMMPNKYSPIKGDIIYSK